MAATQPGRRRSWCAIAVVGWLAGAALAAAVPPAPLGAHVAAPAGATLLYPPDAAPFDATRRLELARTALFFDGDDGVLDTGAYVLPVPLPWPAGAAERRSWTLDVPGGTPLFILAAISLPGQGPASGATLTIDGVPVAVPPGYAVDGIDLPEPGGLARSTALAAVLPPPDPGWHTLAVSCARCQPAGSLWAGIVDAEPRTYLLHVQPPAPAGGAPGATAASALSLISGAPGAPTAGGGVAAAPGLAPSAGAVAAAGIVLERTFYSDALAREMPYQIYLPPGYFDEPDPQPGRRYPVVVLLHGLGAGYRQWPRLGAIEALEREAAAGRPIIAVMPEGRNGYWVNHADGGPLWGDYVARDLMAHIDATYRTIPRREARAIGGISMGAHGALQLALTHPDLFGTIGAHSPALRTRDQAPPFLGGWFPGHTASPGAEAYAARDPISLVRRSTLARLPTLWVDIGQQDGWYARAAELHEVLLDRGWPHTWQPAPGNHDDAYWSRRMPDYLAFYGAALASAR